MRKLFLALMLLSFSSSFSLLQIHLKEEVVYQGQMLEFTITLGRESGSGGDVKVEYWIESPTGERWSYDSAEVYLGPAPSEMNLSRSLYVFSSQSPGPYFLKVVASYGEGFPLQSQSTQFTVLSRSLSVKGAILRILDYPEEISGESGWSNLLNVKIYNAGDEILYNVSLVIDGIPEDWYYISPRSYYKLDPGAEVLFSFRISIPSGAITRDYNLTYRVIGESGAFDEKKGILRVFSSRYALISYEIEKLTSEKQELETKVQAKLGKGYNVTESQKILSFVEVQLQFAADYLRQGNYDDAMIALSNVQSLLTDAEEALLRARKLEITPFYADYRFMLLVLMLIPVSIITYHIWSQRRLAKILSYYSAEVLTRLKESVPGAKLKLRPSDMLMKVQESLKESSKEALRKKLERTKKLLRLIEMQYSTGALSKESYEEIKRGLEAKIDMIERKLEEEG
ncbi:hypothetical protein DRN62_04060 [Nanoarchaeota archaeon]|nr:MAG: hypothetical protein DRN62_04060 [Nanoarchaeota archaeon]